MIGHDLIFQPEKQLVGTPENFDLSFLDVELTTSDDITLHGWYVPGTGEYTLVWFHGNEGNISTRLENIASLSRNLNVNIFIFDYRGYGRSGGDPSEQGTYLDGDSAITYLRSDIGLELSKVVLLGHSLGCAVAVEMAIKYETRALILESGFTSVAAMASRAYPFVPGISLLTKTLVRTTYDTLSKLNLVFTPSMIIHGDSDTVVPYDMGIELYRAANSPKRFLSVEGADHSNAYAVSGEEYYKALSDFIECPTLDVS